MTLEPARRPEMDRRALPRDPAPSGDRPACDDELWSRRRGLERELHDGPALRIAAMTLQLGLLGQKLPRDEPELQRDIGELQDQLHEVLQELRGIADQIYPPLLYEAGLGPALAELAERTPVRVQVDATDERFGPAAEGVAYFTVLECLGIAGTGGPAVRVRVCRDQGDLLLQVADVDALRIGGVIDQIQRMGGVAGILPEPPATIEVRIPCA